MGSWDIGLSFSACLSENHWFALRSLLCFLLLYIGTIIILCNLQITTGHLASPSRQMWNMERLQIGGTPVANLNRFATPSVNTPFMPKQWTHLDFGRSSFSLPSWQRSTPGLMPSVSASSSDIVSATPSCLNKCLALMVGTLKLSQSLAIDYWISVLI